MSKPKDPLKNRRHGISNVDGSNLTFKKSMPQAARFTEPNQNRGTRHRGN